MDLRRWIPVPFAVTLGLPGVLASASMLTHGVDRFRPGEVASTALILVVAGLALAGCVLARPRLLRLAGLGAAFLGAIAAPVLMEGPDFPMRGWTVPYVVLGLLVATALVFLASGHAWSAARAFFARFRTS